jgi:hypothetical protein
VILNFIKNSKLFQGCLVPNLSKILADGRLNLADMPFFLDIVLGIYANINQYVQENLVVTISANDVVELSGLLLKVSLTILVTDPAELSLGVSIINNTIKMVKFTVQNKVKSCALACCCCCRK